MRSPLLTAAEEQLLATRIADGDVSAMQELVTRNTGLAINAARRYGRHSLDEDDRRQAALMALTLAARKFKPGTEARRFAPFARRIIRDALIELTSRSIRSGVSISKNNDRRAAVFGLAAAREALGDGATPQELGRQLGVSAAAAVAIEDAARQPVLLDAVRYDGTTAHDDLLDPSPDPEARLIAQEKRRQLAAALQHLTPRQQQVVEALYIEDELPGTVARRLGMSRAAVVAMAAEAMATLRQHIERE